MLSPKAITDRTTWDKYAPEGATHYCTVQVVTHKWLKEHQPTGEVFYYKGYWVRYNDQSAGRRHLQRATQKPVREPLLPNSVTPAQDTLVQCIQDLFAKTGAKVTITITVGE